MNRLLIAGLFVVGFSLIIGIFNNVSDVMNLEQQKTLTVVLNDDLETTDKEYVKKNYEIVLNQNIKKTNYPNIKIDVKLMTNEALVNYVSNHPDTVGIVDSTDYIAMKKQKIAPDTQIIGSFEQFAVDDNNQILYNEITNLKPVYFQYNSQKNKQFNGMSIREILQFISEHKMTIAVGKGKYDATKIWLYNFLLNYKIPFDKISVREYQNQEEAVMLLANGNVDLVVTDHPPYQQNAQYIQNVRLPQNSKFIQPLSQLIIVNNRTTNVETKLIEDLFVKIYDDAASIEQIKPAYATIDIAQITGYESIEQQSQLEQGIQNYLDYWEGK